MLELNSNLLAQSFKTEPLIETIAQDVGVPVEILQAIAEVESRYQTYALNHQGKSLFFKTAYEAWTYIQNILKKNERASIDIGYMQINWQAHGEKIKYPQLLLNPHYNIRYAAYFLKELYQEFKSWKKAIAAYHSRHQSKGQLYLARVRHTMMKNISIHNFNKQWRFIPIQNDRLKRRVHKILAITGFTATAQYLEKLKLLKLELQSFLKKNHNQLVLKWV